MAEKPSGRGLTVPKNPAEMLRALNSRHAAAPDETTDKPTNQQRNKPTILQIGDEEAETSGAETSPSPAKTGEPPVSEIQTNKQPNTQRNKPTKKQTNNTTEASIKPPVKRDGRTLRARQRLADPTSSIVTSFRISVTTMEMLDRYCFENRVRKQDVVEQALAAFMGEDEE